jgi:dihydroorotase
MPNNQPSIIDLNNLEAKKQLISGRSYVNYGLYMGFDGSNFDEINKTKNIPGVKIYCAHSTGKMGVVDDHIELAFEKIDERVRLLFHAEDEECIGRKREIVLGKYNGENIPPFVHSEIRAPECAVTMVRRLCELAKKYRRAIHICHVSTEEELDIISKYREYGVTCEVAPHHLVLSDEDYDELGNLVKINPPLRRKAEVFAMWKGLKNGFVDIVATDHAPHTLEEKKMGYIEAPSGVPGVEMMLPILLNTVNNGGMTIMDVVKLCCEKPAEIFGLEDKGRIEVGYDADLVVVDMEMEKKFSNEDVESKCGWSPYAGGVFKGWPLKTFVAGVLVCDDGKFSGNTSGNIVKFRR